MRPVPVPRSRRLPTGFGPTALRIAASTSSSAAWSERSRSQFGARRSKKARAATERLARTSARRTRSPASRWSVPSRARQDGAQDLGRGGALAEAEEGPGAFAVPLDEAGLGQELEMTRDSRLRLAQDIGQVRHRELALGQEREHPQPGFLGGGPQSLQGLGQSGGRVVHGCPVR